MAAAASAAPVRVVELEVPWRTQVDVPAYTDTLVLRLPRRTDAVVRIDATTITLEAGGKLLAYLPKPAKAVSSVYVGDPLGIDELALWFVATPHVTTSFELPSQNEIEALPADFPRGIPRDPHPWFAGRLYYPDRVQIDFLSRARPVDIAWILTPTGSPITSVEFGETRNVAFMDSRWHLWLRPRYQAWERAERARAEWARAELDSGTESHERATDGSASSSPG